MGIPHDSGPPPRRWWPGRVLIVSAATAFAALMAYGGDAQARPRCLDETDAVLASFKSATHALRDAERILAAARAPADRALAHCIVAELQQRSGRHADAVMSYRNAITADPDNPEYNVLFGDYWRNVRGPRQPRRAAECLPGRWPHPPDPLFVPDPDRRRWRSA